MKIWKYFIEGIFLRDFKFWAITIILILLVFQFKSCQKEGQLVDMNFKPVKTYKDKDSVAHSVIQNQLVNQETMNRILDSISKNLDVKPEIITQYITVTDTVFRDRPIYLDTVNKSFRTSFKDPHIEIDVDGNLSNNKANFKVKTTDTLTYVSYTKKHLFKGDEHQIDVSSSSPYNTIKEARSFKIKEKKSILTVGPSIIYNPFTNKVQVGVGATLNLFSLKR